MSDFLCPVFAVPVVCRIWRPFLSSILSDKLPSIRTRASAICVTRKRKCGPTDTPSTLDAQSAYMSIPATLGYIFVFLILCSSWPLKAQAPAQSSSSTIVGIEPYGSYTNNLDAINLADLADQSESASMPPRDCGITTLLFSLSAQTGHVLAQPHEFSSSEGCLHVVAPTAVVEPPGRGSSHCGA